jgi:hypothetical protein
VKENIIFLACDARVFKKTGPTSQIASRPRSGRTIQLLRYVSRKNSSSRGKIGAERRAAYYSAVTVSHHVTGLHDVSGKFQT